MIVEMEYYNDGYIEGADRYGIKSVIGADEIGEAYMNGENVILHYEPNATALDDGTLWREGYLKVIGYEPPRTIDSQEYPANIIVPSCSNLVIGDSNTVTEWFTQTAIGEDGKLCLPIYVD